MYISLPTMLLYLVIWSFPVELGVEVHVLLEAVILLLITSNVTMPHAQVELSFEVEELVPRTRSLQYICIISCLPSWLPTANLKPSSLCPLLLLLEHQTKSLTLSSRPAMNTSPTRTMRYKRFWVNIKAGCTRSCSSPYSRCVVADSWNHCNAPVL